MKKIHILIILCSFMLSNIGCQTSKDDQQETGQIRLMTLNPGHFHAALVQRSVIDRLDETVHIYSPGGSDLDLHMQRIEGFNTRTENPTNWQSEIYIGDDYLERMLRDKPGNVMVTAGNNRQKTNYILQTVSNGVNVLSDKPMAIDTEGWEMLVEAFEKAEENNVLLYDIMTERREVTSRILRTLMQDRDLFGELVAGTPEEPAMYKESIHHLFKYVGGSPLRRPTWYFDVNQQGEGIVDVTVHLVDLSMWVAFPDQIVNYEEDVRLLSGKRWPTNVTLEQFSRITGAQEFPEYLAGQLDDAGTLPVYCNGQIDYLLNGHHVRAKVQWNYQAPPGGDDSHFTIIRGTNANLVVRQGEEQDFHATVFVEPVEGASSADIEQNVAAAVDRLQQQYPGASYEASSYGWELYIPKEFHYGHEAHFGMVAESFFDYLERGMLPEWEVPNMITKYYITTHAREMAMQADD
jgi:predicted dehydrogenase